MYSALDTSADRLEFADGISTRWDVGQGETAGETRAGYNLVATESFEESDRRLP